MTNLNKRGVGRFMAAALILTVVIPASLAQAAGNGGHGGGGGGGGGGGNGNGDGGGFRVQSPIEFARDPNCTAGRGCYDRPEITYVKKDNACEIRICEIENGIRKCSVELDDIKVCVTKRS
ncbi:hypothetical protein IZ6_09300 [Terrihabitans soli]|uniref:Uncharacterized protein n=1 Tax=Terrihabitans soli TaxID=708113 RepID=A0A6S6QR21_9HYPH|nr:hypothetical protein [Terrihabitans soli]BCJ90195.1 hypothetical protein IZ6_09300 [Terrihabitans soli]